MRPSIITYPPAGKSPIGVIEFVHGMSETKERYRKTMETFSKHGFICAITDLRGHGSNILTNDDLGFFGDDGYNGLIDDVHDYTMFLKREYPKLPLILIGHSLGSLVVRTFLKKHSKEIDAVIISGSPSNNFLAAPAKLLIRFLAIFRGWHYRSPMITNLITGVFEKPFSNEGIVNSWICSDRNVAEIYNNDPLCGFPFTLNGYLGLLNLIQQTYSKKGWISKNKSLPVMFMSGADDPCRISDKMFRKSVTHLKRCGYPNTYYKLYQDMRHELFNEPENDEVYNDIFKFLEIKVGIEAK